MHLALKYNSAWQSFPSKLQLSSFMMLSSHFPLFSNSTLAHSVTMIKFEKSGTLLPKLFWPTARKNCSSDQEKLLKFEAEGWESAKNLRSLEQFVQRWPDL